MNSLISSQGFAEYFGSALFYEEDKNSVASADLVEVVLSVTKS